MPDLAATVLARTRRHAGEGRTVDSALSGATSTRFEVRLGNNETENDQLFCRNEKKEKVGKRRGCWVKVAHGSVDALFRATTETVVSDGAERVTVRAHDLATTEARTSSARRDRGELTGRRRRVAREGLTGRGDRAVLFSDSGTSVGNNERQSRIVPRKRRGRRLANSGSLEQSAPTVVPCVSQSPVPKLQLS